MYGKEYLEWVEAKMGWNPRFIGLLVEKWHYGYSWLEYRY